MMRKKEKWTPDKHIKQIIIYYIFQLELDGVGPVENRPSYNYLHHVVNF